MCSLQFLWTLVSYGAGMSKIVQFVSSQASLVKSKYYLL